MKTTKSIWEAVVIIALLFGAYFIGKHEGQNQTPQKMQIVQPAPDTTGKGV